MANTPATTITKMAPIRPSFSFAAIETWTKGEPDAEGWVEGEADMEGRFEDEADTFVICAIPGAEDEDVL